MAAVGILGRKDSYPGYHGFMNVVGKFTFRTRSPSFVSHPKRLAKQSLPNGGETIRHPLLAAVWPSMAFIYCAKKLPRGSHASSTVGCDQLLWMDFQNVVVVRYVGSTYRLLYPSVRQRMLAETWAFSRSPPNRLGISPLGI